MDLKQLTAEIDQQFGFSSAWTFNIGDGCWELGGTINIDEQQLDEMIRHIAGHAAQADLVRWFVCGHEKGHHLQELLSPGRQYELEQHAMEIEADLFGAWSLALRDGAIVVGHALDVVKKFDDANRMSKKLGITTGGPSGRSPDHPWAEQRELALVKGPLLALNYPSITDLKIREAFAREVRLAARRAQYGL